jgi:hypothetical protein
MLVDFGIKKHETQLSLRHVIILVPNVVVIQYVGMSSRSCIHNYFSSRENSCINVLNLFAEICLRYLHRYVRSEIFVLLSTEK